MSVIPSKVCLRVYILLVSVAVLRANDVIVSTSHGQVRGSIKDSSLEFLGIPYARPPVGKLRWRSPEAPTSWEPDIYDATSDPPGCPQVDCEESVTEINCPERTSEDCLYLNIWTPRGATSSSSFPVMVAIPGGAFEIGSVSGKDKDGDYLANKTGIVVVVINYKLGEHAQWVQDNIAQFGGDPNKVTLQGQSAGGQSVDIHLKSPKSQGLFHRAIIQSAPFDVPYRTKADALTQARWLRGYLNCWIGRMACLRLKSVDVILEAQEQLLIAPSSAGFVGIFEPIRPIVDGEDVLAQALEGARLEQYNGVPTLIGNTKDEARIYVYGLLPVPFPYIFFAGIAALLRPDSFLSIMKKYPRPDGQLDTSDTASEFATDYLFACPSRFIARKMTNLINSEGTYRYIFDFQAESDFVGRPTVSDICRGYTCHSTDVPYVFGNTDSEEEKQLSESIVAYWTNFVHTGDPNNGPSETRLGWPTYDPSSETTMFIGRLDNSLVEDYRGNYCDFWDDIGYDN